jgi:antitoxin component YwqK of YwqJK toxin-antitoxin module
MVEEIGDITRDLLHWIMHFDLDSLLSLFYVNIKEAFDDLLFEPLVKDRIYYCPNYLGYRCYDLNGDLIYKGQVKNNMRHGFGTEYYKSTDKVKFDGKFALNLPNGNFCKYFDENGFEIYAGHFSKGFPIGGYFFDDRNSTLYIGKFDDYKLDGKNCYTIDKNDLMLSSGRFIKGKPYNKDFKMYYQSGCLLYKGSSEDGVTGHFYHDGLFRHDSEGNINSKSILFPEKKTDLQADINFILNETMKGTDLMTLKYEFYEHFNYKQVVLTMIKKNEERKNLFY